MAEAQVSGRDDLSELCKRVRQLEDRVARIEHGVVFPRQAETPAAARAARSQVDIVLYACATAFWLVLALQHLLAFGNLGEAAVFPLIHADTSAYSLFAGVLLAARLMRN